MAIFTGVCTRCDPPHHMAETHRARLVKTYQDHLRDVHPNQWVRA